MFKRLFYVTRRQRVLTLGVGALGLAITYFFATSPAVGRHSESSATPNNARVLSDQTTIRTNAAILPQPPPVPPDNYGFSAGELVWLSDAQRSRQLEAMKATGARWVRFDMQWYVVQPSNANTYNWSIYDRTIDAIKQHGLNALAILDYAPAWAAMYGCVPNVNHKCAPADPQTFAAFATAAARRYTPQGVTGWEIWNEPNAPTYWYPRVNASDYAALLKATYPAIKKVNPKATVITAGLRSTTTTGSLDQLDYITDLYAAGGGPYFDALGAHPYSYPALPSATTYANGWTQMLALHDIAASHGDAGKKIWMTEVGAATGGPHPVSENRQAQIIAEAMRLRDSYPWAGPLFWYDFKDLGTRYVTEDHYGLVRPDGTPKPAYHSFVEAIKSDTAIRP